MSESEDIDWGLVAVLVLWLTVAGAAVAYFYAPFESF